MADNVFEACAGSQPLSLTVPYAYDLSASADVPAIVLAGAGVGKR